MANGAITGKEVFSNVVEEAKKVDQQLKNVLGSYKAIIAELQNFKSASQGNQILKQRINLDKESIGILNKLVKLNKSVETSEKGVTSARRRGRSVNNTNIGQLKNLNSFYGQQSRLLNDLRNKYKSLNLRKIQGAKLTKAEAAAMKQLEARVRKLDSALKKADAAAGQFNRNVGNYPKGLRLATGALRSFLGAFGFTSGIFLFASAIKDALSRVREFDKSMQNLAGILRTNRADLGDVEAEIIRVAGSSIKTSREVANLAESLATLGLRGQALKDLIKPANDLAIGLETSSAEAAEFLVQNLNAFGESSASARDYSQTIAAIRTTTSLDFQRMRDSFQYLLPISRILGDDLSYTGGIIGLLNDNSIKAEQGARLLGTAQQKLAKQGLSLADALDVANKATEEGKTGQEQLAIVSNLVGVQAAKVIVTLSRNADKIGEYAQRIRDADGALDDLVNEQLKSLDSQIKILDSTWERLILTIENGEGSYARFFKGITLGLTGYLEEIIAVEEAQNKVFKAQIKPIEDQIVAQRLLQKETSTTVDEYEASIAKVNELNEKIIEISETGGERGSTFLNSFGKIMTLGLVDINREFDDLVDIQREFNRNLSNLDKNTSISFLEDEFNRLTVEVFRNNELTQKQRNLYVQQRDAVADVLRNATDYRSELLRQANSLIDVESKLESYRKNLIKTSNDGLVDFIKKNRSAAFAVKELGEALEAEPNTIKKLREEVKQLNEIFETTQIGTEDFTVAQNALIAKQKELSEALKALKKARKEQDRAVKGSIGALEKLIQEEKKAQKNTITTADALVESQKKINGYKEEIADLTQKLTLFNEIQKLVGKKVKVQFNGTGNDTFGQRNQGQLFDPNESTTRSPEFEEAFKGFDLGDGTKISFDIEIPEDDFAKMQEELKKIGEAAADSAEQMREEIEKTGKFYRGIFKSIFSATQDLYNVDLEGFIQLLDKKETAKLTSEEKLQAYSQASQDTLISFNDSLLSATLSRLDQEEDANRSKLQRVLDDESSTQEEKDEAQKRYDAENLKIRQKQFKAEQKAAKAQVAINTAVAIIQAYAQLGPVGGTIAGVIITALSLLQQSNIDRQKPPQFFKGKKATDNFEGWGTVGEKGKEVIIGKDGSTEVTPGTTTPRWINKDDIIIPSIAQYDREIKDPSSDTFKRVNKKLISDTNFRTNMVVVHNNNDFGNLEDRIEKAIKKGFKGTNINISQKSDSGRRTRFVV